MDLGESSGGIDGGFGDEQKKPRPLPADLPKSLNDRRIPAELVQETEFYDAWQGTPQFWLLI